MSARRDFEYIVLGLGGLGSAAAYWLSRRAGKEVLGIEQFELGHVRGESQDHSRIIRHSYHTPEYVRLTFGAYDAWDDVAKEAGEPLYLVTGGLDLGPRESAIPAEPYRASLRACGVPFESLDAREIMRRFPQFTVGDDVEGIFQARGGIAMAAKGNGAHQRLARAHGATLVERAPVTAIAHHGGEFSVTAGGETYRGRRLVIAAGPWSNGALGHLGVHLPLEITREQVTYFATPHRDEFAPGRFPVWIWLDDPCYSVSRCSASRRRRWRRIVAGGRPRETPATSNPISRTPKASSDSSRATSHARSGRCISSARASTRSRPIAISCSTPCRVTRARSRRSARDTRTSSRA